MNRVRWIDANGKRILYADYSGIKSLVEQMAILAEQRRQEKLAVGGLLDMHNFTDALGSVEMMNKLKDDTVKSEKTALIGIEGLKGILLQGFLKVTNRTNIKACKTEEEAINFLTS